MIIKMSCVIFNLWSANYKFAAQFPSVNNIVLRGDGSHIREDGTIQSGHQYLPASINISDFSIACQEKG